MIREIKWQWSGVFWHFSAMLLTHHDNSSDLSRQRDAKEQLWNNHWCLSLTVTARKELESRQVSCGSTRQDGRLLWPLTLQITSAWGIHPSPTFRSRRKYQPLSTRSLVFSYHHMHASIFPLPCTFWNLPSLFCSNKSSNNLIVCSKLTPHDKSIVVDAVTPNDRRSNFSSPVDCLLYFFSTYLRVGAAYQLRGLFFIVSKVSPSNDSQL